MPHKNSEKQREANRIYATKHRAELGISNKIADHIKPWRLKNRDKYLAQKRRWYQKNRKDQRIKNKNRNALLRRMVLTHYSNGTLECACCGENIYEFLTLNHINGGGVKERKENNLALSRMLIRKNYPEGYNVLCYNCNCADAFAKGCPHKLLLALKGPK